MAIAHALGLLDHDADDGGLLATTAADWRVNVKESLDALEARSQALAEKQIGHLSEMAMVEVRESQYTDVGQPVMAHWASVASRQGLRVRLDAKHKPIFAVASYAKKSTYLVTARESFLGCVDVHPAVGIRMVKLRKDDDARPSLPTQMVRLKLMWSAAAAKAAGELCLERCEACCVVGGDMSVHRCPLCTMPLHESCSNRVMRWMQREWHTYGMRLGDAVAWPWERVQSSLQERPQGALRDGHHTSTRWPWRLTPP